jgi:hypothetical protein
MCSGCWKSIFLWFTCNCWKMSPWTEEEFSYFLRNHPKLVLHVRSIFLDGSLLPPSSWNFSICTTSHWLIYWRKKKIQELHYLWCFPTRTRLCFIAISYCWCDCLLAIVILLIFLELYTVVHILRIQQHYLTDIYWNYLFRHTKYEVWFHQTRAESQAAAMVGVPQDFDIGLCENPAMLMLLLTQLSGRPIAIIPWFLKNNHSPWGFCVTHPKSYPLWSLSNPEVQPLLDN